jgi:6-phosphofructokinase 1
MGRHAGWIAAAGGLAKNSATNAPHIILFPEVKFNQKDFLLKVKKSVAKDGYCVVVASEGIKNTRGKFLTESKTTDSFGHAQLGGVAPYLSSLVSKNLKYKTHWAVPDYLQRSARHLSSKTDLMQAQAVGAKAVEYAVKGMNSVMPIIVRNKTKKYSWKIESASLSKIANVEKKLPRSYITKDGYGITKKAIEYLQPLIKGEAEISFKDGIPKVETLKLIEVNKKLRSWT